MYERRIIRGVVRNSMVGMFHAYYRIRQKVIIL